MNSFLLTLTALLILVLSALFAAPLFIDWNDYRPVFEQQASKLLGRDVKVGGKVHLVLLPSPELKFDDVKVADEQGSLERPFLEARSIEAWLNIGALLTGSVEARKIVIVDPVLRVDVKEDGTGNWRDVGRAGVAMPFAPKEVMLDSLSVSGGRIEISKEGVKQITLEAVEGDASAASLSGPYKVTAAYDYAGRRQELRFSTSQADAEGLVRVKAALRDPERDTTYMLDGAVTGLGGKPAYDGSFVMRVANAAPEEAPLAEIDPGEPASDPAQPAIGDAQENGAKADAGTFFELKGPLTATPDHAELPDFDLTIHASGRPQILKGKLAFDFGEQLKTAAELQSRFIDLDTLFGPADPANRLSPGAVLYQLADRALSESAELGEVTLHIALDQASLGGDLLGGLELALATNQIGVKLERLKATLPGDNRIEVSGQLGHGDFGPVFTGPLKLEGSGLRTLTRWAAGDRDMSGQASIGDFTLQANATVGDGVLKLADAQGELSGTKFGGALLYRGGERNLIELSLDSDRLDLREMIGEGPIWRSWLPTSTLPAAPEGNDAAPAPEPNLLAQFRDDDISVTLHVGELLLPNIETGKLDARFTLLSDTLNVETLDFAAGDALALTGKGKIERLSESPAGRVDFALRAATTDSLRIAAQLFGMPESVSKSKQLSALAPLDIHVGLVASTKGDVTQASLDLAGKAGGSDVKLLARGTGDLAKLGEADIDIDGSVVGERPQALLVLLFPDLPQNRLAGGPGTKGKLTVKLAGVPNTKVTGEAALDTASLQLAFGGEGSLQETGLALAGKGSIASQDTGVVLMLLGLEAPPSSAGVPLSLGADLVKQGGGIDLSAIKGSIAGEPVDATAHFDIAGDVTQFVLAAKTGSASLPALLGTLVAWQRTPSTEEMLGAIGVGASEVWPSRGFSLGAMEHAEGDITLTAETLSLGSAFPLAGATLVAHLGSDGLAITDLNGKLFSGAFAATGLLSPRGAGASLRAAAELKGGKLEEVAKSIAGSSLAKGPFDLSFVVAGEGLSPPGLVAGLSGEGTLSLGAGALQALSPDPLRRAAAAAARKNTDQEQIEAEARSLREKLTKGIYKYPPAKLPFEVKNGTLRLQPTTLAGGGAETKINAYVELASLKLDSEWVMRLAGKANKDFPPVSVVFAGPLNKPEEIAPAVDTAAIERYLAMRNMQEGVERLETLDVSGRTPPAESEPAEEPPSSIEELLEAEPSEEASPAQEPAPMAGTEPQNLPWLQSVPTAKSAPPATEAMQMPVPNAQVPGGVETAATPPAETLAPADAPQMPVFNAEPEDNAEATETPSEAPAPAPPVEMAAPAPDEPSPMPAADPEGQSIQAIEEPDLILEQPTPAAAEMAPEPPRVQRPPRRAGPRREAPDAWKKGIGIFGGG